ncbi:MAG: bifunctional glutamate N-acetyltransferase/amino-acid acetyltransferase ArgJ, partial [Pseudomonadota bacterium]
VIGEPLVPEKFEAVMDNAIASAAPGGFNRAAAAIMTTDTFPKARSATAMLGETPVTLVGIAKGAGMIAPDMATMLSFVFTDASIAAPVLQTLLAAGTETSFNCVTIDSDTSTSDTLMMFATGKAQQRGAPPITDRGDPRLEAFASALNDLLHALAMDVVRDGEGLSKVFSVTVSGAESDPSARIIARSIANSPLVKTAIAGSDANWGRVVMAVGKAGEPADRDRLAIWFGPICVAQDGERHPDYSEEEASAYMQNSEIAISVDLGIGTGRSVVYSCDLTADYVAINADYRS